MEVMKAKVKIHFCFFYVCKHKAKNKG